MKRVLLVDMDTPVFAAASALEKRSVLVTHNPTGKSKVFDTRTEFKDVLKSKNKLDKLNEYSFLDQQEPEPIENSCQVLKKMLKSIENQLEADEVMYFISGSNNFRDELEFKTRYKSGRASMLRPLLLKDVKQFAIKKYKPEVCHGAEPDDMTIVRAYEVKNRGDEAILVSPDKDALAYSGLKIFNQQKPEQGVIEIPELGSLWIDNKNKVRGLGFLWYCTQMEVGDITDSYRPTELCGVKFGEKSAYKQLHECKSEKEALEVVLKQYKSWYPKPVTYTAWNEKEYTKDYVEIASLYHKAVRMKSHEFDDLDFVKFCNQYGVQA